MSIYGDKLLEANKLGLYHFIFQFEGNFYFCQWIKSKWTDPEKIKLI